MYMPEFNQERAVGSHFDQNSRTDGVDSIVTFLEDPGSQQFYKENGTENGDEYPCGFGGFEV